MHACRPWFFIATLRHASSVSSLQCCEQNILSNLYKFDMEVPKIPSVEELRERFQAHDVRNKNRFTVLPVPPDLRKASVLIPLFYKGGQLHILLTIRSKNLKNHAGFVAFPGGFQEKSDKDEITTALREAQEEIGLKPNDVEVIAVLPPSIVRPSSAVSPVVGIIPEDFKPNINHEEVSLVFTLPLLRFLSNERVTVQSEVIDGHAYNLHYFHDSIGETHVITWGFTGSHCVRSALVAFESKMTFHFYDEDAVNKDNAFDPISYNKFVTSSHL
ncbi:hypothetical protein CHS0354_018912 [Potamilus streckersoni]|uniref:Nudix hydrolase domain-containing protein n=1 Tax=Potamilus streckersoni TaxID=2493646 RepID=A0AAE0RMX9_9BIVA|nr:hypothetical protein CHS0354_018912 [Potamilus streckersoni]